MDINKVVNVPGMSSLSGAKSAEIPAVRIPTRQAQPEVRQEVKIPADIEKARFAEVKRAAEVVQNIFVVSDMRFTIFKDLAGDYVTRFTSLRDGTVKYFPQKSLFEMVQIRNGGGEQILFDTQA